MVMWENNRCSILFHFEVPGGRWHTVISSPVSAANAASSAFDARVAVGPAAVCADQQRGRGRVAVLAHRVPPVADALHGERGGVVVDPDRDPADVGGQVVDAVRDGLAQLGVFEVVHVDLLGGPLGRPFLAAVLELADQLFLLGVHADHRLARGERGRGPLVEVAELAVPVGVLVASRVLALPCRL
jgi:hypothetical protein